MSFSPVGRFSELSLHRKVTFLIIFSAMWFVLDQVAHLFLQKNFLCSWYPNAGTSLGFAIYFGPVAVVIEILLRFLITTFYWHQPFTLATALTYYVLPAVLSLFVSYPVRRIIMWKGRVQSPEVGTVFTISIVVIGFFKSGLILLANSISGMVKFSDFFTNTISWWSGDLIGMITVAPLIVLIIGPLLSGDLKISHKPNTYFRAVGFTLMILSTIGLIYQCIPENHYTYWHLMIPIHVIAAVVMGLSWMSIQIFIVNMSLTVFEYHFPSDVLPFEQQAFLTVLSGVGLYLAILFEEKKVHEQKIKNQPTIMSQSEEAEALFVNILSHELRTPLSAVIGYAEIMMKENSSSMNEIGLQKIRANTEKLVNLVDRLSQFVNPQLVFKTSKKEKVDLAKVAQSVFAKHSLSANLKNIKLSYTADQKVELFNNPDVIFGILDELVSNSIKFTAEGAVVIKAVIIKDEVHITIEDSGIGMAQGFQPFATFEQESKGLTREFAGLGIGLSTCRMWAESIGGKLTLIYSEKGKGTRFLLVFKTLM